MRREGGRAVKDVYIMIRATKDLQSEFKEKAGIARTLLVASKGGGRNLPYPETAEIVITALDEYIKGLQRELKRP